MPIVTVPNPVLRKVAQPVTVVNKNLLDIVDRLTRDLLAARDPEGVGLAAPQIGNSQRIFLARPDLKKPPLLFINPEIINLSQRLQPAKSGRVYEGCLSIPHHYSPVKRSMSVTVKYQTLPANLMQVFPKNRAQPDAGNDQAVEHDFLKTESGFISKTETYSGLLAHIVQHEVDHLNGILFIDHVLEQGAKLFLIKGDISEEISI